jgi:hypothetical protein
MQEAAGNTGIRDWDVRRGSPRSCRSCRLLLYPRRPVGSSPPRGRGAQSQLTLTDMPCVPFRGSPPASAGKAGLQCSESKLPPLWASAPARTGTPLEILELQIGGVPSIVSPASRRLFASHACPVAHEAGQLQEFLVHSDGDPTRVGGGICVSPLADTDAISVFLPEVS